MTEARYLSAKPRCPESSPRCAGISIQPESLRAETRPRASDSPGSQPPPQANHAGWDLPAGKKPPFPVAYSFPRPMTRGGGKDGGRLRKLAFINPVHASAPAEGRGAPVGGAGCGPLTGGRRCHHGRNFTLPGRQLRHLRLVARLGQPPPACFSFRQILLKDPEGEETPPSGQENL